MHHIPLYVPYILAALLFLGWQQSRHRTVTARRLLMMNGVLSVVTLAGVIQRWYETPWLIWGLVTWTLACAWATWHLGQQTAPEGARYDSDTARYMVPGSWWPLALFMLVFAVKFGVGVLQAVAPDVIRNAHGALLTSAVYGVFSGVFNARAWRILKLKNNW